MKISRRRAVAALMLLAWSGVALAVPATGESSRLAEFELRDQFDEVHRSADYRGRYLVLLGSDRAGSKFSPEWGKAILEALDERPGAERVAVVYLAHLGGVPGFLKGFITRKFPRDERNWILLDWEGLFEEAYGSTRKSSNILVFAPNGDLLERHAGREPDASVVERLVDTVAPPGAD